MDAMQLVRYNLFLRRRFAEFFAREVPLEVLAEDHETSHQNIKDVFMHGCNMEDWWLHYLWPGKEWDGPAYDGFTSAGDMLKRVVEVEKKTEAFLKTLKPADLQAKKVVAGSGYEKALTLEQVLVESVMEDTHHRGEIHAMLWRKDIEPPYVSYAAWASGQLE